MDNPVLVEVTRGGIVESAHRGAVSAIDAAGRAILSIGDTARPVFPRSAVKVLQALPLIETGAADAFGFGPRELSLACASHSGEPGHVALAADMLAHAGLNEGALECGCHWPFDLPVALDLARAERRPGPLHNNCSGKHAGFLATAVHACETVSGYVEADHPVQRRARAAMEAVTGCDLGADACGTDGCSIPTYAAPVEGFARAFSRLVSSSSALPADRRAAGRRLIEACMAHPWEMSGTGRACERLMAAAPGRVFAKTGAEGVFCGALPDLGIGFALKIDDGATRASEALVAAVIAQLLRREDASLAERFDELSRTTLRNWEKVPVGEVRARALL